MRPPAAVKIRHVVSAEAFVSAPLTDGREGLHGFIYPGLERGDRERLLEKRK